MAKGRSQAESGRVSATGSARQHGRQSPSLSAADGYPARDHKPAPSANQAERLRRRAVFLRELAEAKELRARVRPRRTRVARLREALRRATYRN